jgi:DNA polymerase-3 subunit delta'
METDDNEVTSGLRPIRNLELYPWHQDAWRLITRDMGRLPHALLLHGPAGLAKTAFALRLAQSLVCQNPGPERQACGRCRGCELFAAGTHPDAYTVFPEEDRRQITVDQVRSLIGFLLLKPHAAPRRVVIVSPAEAMNINAANSLLKVLEEPPGGILLLVSSAPTRLAATVRSRCAKIEFRLPAATLASEWLSAAPRNIKDAPLLLRLASGSPQRALQYADGGFIKLRGQLMADLEGALKGITDPVACAMRWKTHGAEISLTWLYGVLADLIKLSVSRNVEASIINADWADRLHDLLLDIDISKLYVFLQYVSESISLLSGPLDEQLLLEDILIRAARLAKQSSTMKSQTA